MNYSPTTMTSINFTAINLTGSTPMITTTNNNSDNRAIMMFIEQFSLNRRIENPWYYVLIFMYTLLIIIGVTGNTLVVITILRKPNMRTPRNLFILNLATSDLLLCLITMPLTLVEIVSKYWAFSDIECICKIMGTLQAVSIFVSTLSITAIALDRYQVIVYPTRDNLQFIGTISILLVIWAVAIFLASPMFFVRVLITEQLPTLLQSYGISGSVSYCIEDWPMPYGNVYYSAFSLSFQYALPILIVSGAYFGIYHKLKHRLPVGVSVATNNNTTGRGFNTQSGERRMERGRRLKRTNCLLISIAMIFGISWLPLNIFNLYADITNMAFTQKTLILYAFCHMIAMSSACSNPLLYGWLNENFRKEFKELLCRGKKNSNITGGGMSVSAGKSNKNGKSNRIRRQTMNTEISHVEQKLIDTETIKKIKDDDDGGGDDDCIDNNDCNANRNTSQSTTIMFKIEKQIGTELNVLTNYKNNDLSKLEENI